MELQLKKRFKNVVALFRDTFSSFSNENVFRLSAALSYYALFSIPPMLIIIIGFSGIFLGKDAVSGQLFNQIQGILGDEVALQIEGAIKNLELSGKNFFATVLGVLVLLFSSSRLFAEIQEAINQIWGIQTNYKRGYVKFLKNRLMSFTMILGIGMLLIFALIFDTIIDLFAGWLTDWISYELILMYQMINWAFLFLIMTILFTIIFKTLPDGDVRLFDCIKGALLTAVLFMLGKFGISFYLSHSPVGSLYGAASSLIILLLWVYYSSNILYFGVAFTKAYANQKGRQIKPDSNAVKYHRQMVVDEEG